MAELPKIYTQEDQTKKDVKNLAVRALQDDALDECGWLSDAQGAQLELFNESVGFCGEGSIDLWHMVEIVLGVLESNTQEDTNES